MGTKNLSLTLPTTDKSSLYFVRKHSWSPCTIPPTVYHLTIEGALGQTIHLSSLSDAQPFLAVSMLLSLSTSVAIEFIFPCHLFDLSIWFSLCQLILFKNNIFLFMVLINSIECMRILTPPALGGSWTISTPNSSVTLAGCSWGPGTLGEQKHLQQVEYSRGKSIMSQTAQYVCTTLLGIYRSPYI